MSVNNTIREIRTQRGWSQADLADKLGVSRQTVVAVESGKTDPSLPLAFRIAWTFNQPIESIFQPELEEKMTALKASWAFQDRAATAFDEMAVLDEMGAEGWEMVGFGPGYLRFRRPEQCELREGWLYERKGVLGSMERRAMERAGWTYCGSWMGVFHYFKRVGTKAPAVADAPQVEGD